MNRVIPILMILVSLLILILSLNIEDHSVLDPASAAFFPGLISVVILGCGFAVLRRGVIVQTPDQKSSNDTEVNETVVEKEKLTKSQLAKRIIIFVFCVWLFTFLMGKIHFLILSFIYLFGTMMILNRQRSKWLGSLITATLTSVIIYFVFVYVFEIVFP